MNGNIPLARAGPAAHFGIGFAARSGGEVQRNHQFPQRNVDGPKLMRPIALIDDFPMGGGSLQLQPMHGQPTACDSAAATMTFIGEV